MPTIIRTPMHGIYNVAPGSCVSIGDASFVDSLVYVAEKSGGSKPVILDVAGEDMTKWVFYLSGCPSDQIPAPNYAWYAAIAYAKAPIPGKAVHDDPSEISDENLQRIANAVQDEEDRRARLRLERS